MKRLLTLLGLAAVWMTAFAQNPITSVMYTPDPAPYVHDGKLYMFVDHDEDDATNYKMKDWEPVRQTGCKGNRESQSRP